MSENNTKKSGLQGNSTLPPVKDRVGNNGRETPESDFVLKGSKQKHYSAKEVIYRESERVDKIYLIRSGLVKLLSYLPNGRVRIVRLQTRDNWSGLEGLVGQLYEHTAIAVGEVEVEYVSISSLHLLERESPGEYCQVLKQGYKHLAQADKWIADFSTGDIKSRVARLLEFLAELNHDHGELSGSVQLLTVHEMADILGVTPESVSRIVAAFKRRNILQRQVDSIREIYTLDTVGLHREVRTN